MHLAIPTVIHAVQLLYYISSVQSQYGERRQYPPTSTSDHTIKASQIKHKSSNIAILMCVNQMMMMMMMINISSPVPSPSGLGLIGHVIVLARI